MPWCRACRLRLRARHPHIKPRTCFARWRAVPVPELGLPQRAQRGWPRLRASVTLRLRVVKFGLVRADGGRGRGGQSFAGAAVRLCAWLAHPSRQLHLTSRRHSKRLVARFVAVWLGTAHSASSAQVVAFSVQHRLHGKMRTLQS